MAWHSKPETRENATPQADGAEVQRCTEGRASKQFVRRTGLTPTNALVKPLTRRGSAFFHPGACT
jgi:hypothetical protein